MKYIHNSLYMKPCLVLLVCLVSTLSPAFSSASPETKKDTAVSKQDSSPVKQTQYRELLSKMKVVVEKERGNSRVEFLARQATEQQNDAFTEIKNKIEQARNILKQGYSYQKIKKEIVQLRRWQKIAGEGVIHNKDSNQTVRNLTTTSILLKELLNKTENMLSEISAYHKSLGRLQHNLDSLMMDSVLYILPSDSVAFMRYVQKLVLLGKDYKPVIEPLRTALDSTEKLELDVKVIKFSLEANMAETELQRRRLFENVNLIETGSFSRNITHEKPIENVLRFSISKAELVLAFYVINHLTTLVLMGLFILAIGFYLTLLRKKSNDERSRDIIKEDTSLFTHPFASATLMVVTVFQFFLPLPPFIFSGLLWIISGVAVLIIIRKTTRGIWFYTWVAFYVFFLVGFFANLLLRQSMMERWLMPVFILLLLTIGLYHLLRPKNLDKNVGYILFFLSIMVAIELLAFINYFSGGYNQAKTLMAGGIFNILIAYYLYWTVRLGNKTLKLSLHFFKNPEEYNPEKEEPEPDKKIPFVLYILFFIGWFLLLSRNFYYYQVMFRPMEEWIVATRSIGEFTFTLKSIFIFFGVLLLSGLISQIVSFFASDTSLASNQSKSGGLGSWMLLIRIAIITSGVMLAFVSAGIPMDKFAIILGALSVGIGFGLQTLVNNLVSGLIIAFEKPVNVGDIVEITGKIGKMKSIGIRSSVVTTWDGADVIIPNGDLLNQHLVNWTLGSRKRRFDLKLGVAYGTDLDKTKELLLEVMTTDPRILKYPEPFVQTIEFNNSSIDLIMKFWVADFSIGFDVKSDLFMAIDKLFKEHGIVIPFPQQDVHIMSVPPGSSPQGA